MDICNLVSVVIPCYNQAQFLRECIESVISQTYPKWEMLVVDDGSTDNTKDIALSYAEKDNRIKYLYKENGGLPSARNYGLYNACGTYFLPLDSDDKIESTYIERGVKALESNHDCIMYNTNIVVFGNENERRRLINLSYQQVLYGNTLHPTGLYRTSTIKEIGGYDEKLRKGCEELEFFIRLLYKNDNIYHDEEYLFYYRKWGNNTMSTSAYRTHKKELFDYIFKKHVDKYIEYFGNPIDMLNSYSWAERKLPQLAKRIQEHWQKMIDKIRK